jgi:eukaryotic-like serine/threonine-protein kinase
MPEVAELGVATRSRATQRARRPLGEFDQSLSPGCMIADRYRVVSLVGRGGMGEVYSAYDTAFERHVALKTVLGAVAEPDLGLGQLSDEAAFGLRVRHPHVCWIYEQGVHSSSGDQAPVHFLTMELIDGPRLGTLLRSRRLKLSEVVAIARQLLCGLEAIHAAGVLHLDLKSDNVMLRRPWRPHEAVIIDFGLSASRKARSRQGPDKIAGTVSYMAPERVLALNPSAESDVFSFGVILFEMLTQRLPFGAGSVSPAASVVRRLTDAAPAPSTFWADVPPALDAFVLRCLEGSRRRRFRNAGDALAAFDLAVRSTRD